MDIEDGEYVGTDVWAFFKQRGFNYEGQGSFGVVMSHPKLNYVVKIFDAADKGYPAFLKFVESYGPSEYLPKFIGKPMKISDKMYALRMEKLSKDTPPEWPGSDDYRSLAAVMTSPRHEDGIAIAKYHNPDDLVDLVQAMSVYAEKHRLANDLKMDNIMMRGNTPVIIDPYVKY